MYGVPDELAPGLFYEQAKNTSNGYRIVVQFTLSREEDVDLLADAMQKAARTETSPRCAHILRRLAGVCRRRTRLYSPRVLRPRRSEDDIDHGAIQRVLEGVTPYPVLSSVEVRLAVAQLVSTNLSSREIARRVGVNSRTVDRYRSDNKRKQQQ